MSTTCLVERFRLALGDRVEALSAVAGRVEAPSAVANIDEPRADARISLPRIEIGA